MHRLAVLAVLALTPNLASAQDRAPDEALRRELTRCPRPLASFGAAVVGRHLYLIGGHVGRPHHHSIDNLSTGFYRLNLVDRSSWEALPGGVALQSVALVAHKDALIRVGGLSARNREDAAEDLHSTDEVQRYDPLARAWTPLPSLPEKRSSHDAFVVGDALVVLGGWRLAGDEIEWFKHGWSLDLADPKAAWAKIEQPFRRRALAVTAHGSKVYAIGGITRKGDVSSRVDVYDTKTQSWSKIDPLPGPGFGAAAVSTGASLYATDWTGAVHQLIEGSSWKRAADMDFPRFFHRLVAIGQDELAAIAGASFGGKIRNIEWIDLSEDRDPAPRITRFSVPYPGEAIGKAGMALRRADLAVFGGYKDSGFSDPPPRFKDSYIFNINRLRFTKTAPLPRAEPTTDGVFLGEKGEEAYAFQGSALLRFQRKDRTWSASELRGPVPGSEEPIVKHADSLWLFKDGKVFRFKPQAGAFEDIGAPASPKALGGLAGAVLDDRVFLVGGYGNAPPTALAFDFKAKTWSELPAPTRRRRGGAMVALGGRLFLAGGLRFDQARSEFVPDRSLEVYDPAARRWSVLIVDHGLSSNRARLFTFNKRLLLVGFRSSADFETRYGENILSFALIDPKLPALPKPRAEKAAPADTKKGQR